MEVGGISLCQHLGFVSGDVLSKTHGTVLAVCYWLSRVSAVLVQFDWSVCYSVVNVMTL